MYDLGGRAGSDQHTGTFWVGLVPVSSQASMAFKKQFAVKVTFRQLLEETPTPDALAEYIDAQLPPLAPVPASPSPVNVLLRLGITGKPNHYQVPAVVYAKTKGG